MPVVTTNVWRSFKLESSEGVGLPRERGLTSGEVSGTLGRSRELPGKSGKIPEKSGELPGNLWIALKLLKMHSERSFGEVDEELQGTFWGNSGSPGACQKPDSLSATRPNCLQDLRPQVPATEAAIIIYQNTFCTLSEGAPGKIASLPNSRRATRVFRALRAPVSDGVSPKTGVPGGMCSRECPMALGQKSCRTKVSRIFRFFVPNFAPNFAPNFLRIF